MFRLPGEKTVLFTIGLVGIFAAKATAQNSGMGAGTVFRNNYHISFERPEAWGLKYFASVSLLSGLPAPASPEGEHAGTITVGLEMDWIPTLNAGQQRIGFDGTSPENLNNAPVFARPVIRIGLPHKFSLIAAAPPPLELFGVRSHLLAFGVERPLLERGNWTLGWRGYGQVGSVRGAFTCPNSVLGFAPGSAGNPTACLGQSADEASLRYAGSEVELSYRLPRNPKIIPHIAAGGNFIDAAFQTHAPVTGGLDETRLWTRGGTFSGTAGITYRITNRASFTVDAFYSPLWVRRDDTAPRTNDGLFNFRALLSYTFR
jgi:hypothetical protein